LVNALIALVVVRTYTRGAIFRSAAVVAGVIAAVIGYGIFRLSQDTLMPGPSVMVVQSNFPMKRGVKTVSQEEAIAFHIKATEEALARAGGAHLVACSKTSMPPPNPEPREEFGNCQAGPVLPSAHEWLAALAVTHH